MDSEAEDWFGNSITLPKDTYILPVSSPRSIRTLAKPTAAFSFSVRRKI